MSHKKRIVQLEKDRLAQSEITIMLEMLTRKAIFSTSAVPLEVVGIPKVRKIHLHARKNNVGSNHFQRFLSEAGSLPGGWQQ